MNASLLLIFAPSAPPKFFRKLGNIIKDSLKDHYISQL